MTRAPLFGAWLALGLACSLVPACSGEDDPAADDTGDDDSNGNGSSSGATSGGSSGRSSTSSSGGSSGKSSSSGGRDATVPDDDDAAADPSDGGSGLFEPKPGTPCPIPGETFTRPCNACGTQLAFCAPGGTVTGYGSCAEPPTGCPNDGGPEPDAGGSSSGGSSGSVPDAGPSTLPTLVLGTSVAAVTTLSIPTSQGKTTKPAGPGSDTFACPLTLSDEVTEHAYVLVQNPNAAAAKIDLQVVGGGDSFLVVYSSFPASDAAREACVGFYDNGCGAFTGPGCLLTADGPTVPGNGSVVAYISRYAVPSPWEAPSLRATVRSLP